MFLLSFIRTYYLFLYYKIAVINKSKSGKPDTMQAFLALAIFINAMPLLLLFFELRRLDFISHFYDYVNFPLIETHRGTVTGGALFVWVVSSALTYFLCVFRISFEEIKIRISESSVFRDEASWKAIAPVCVQMIILFFLM